MNIFRILGDFSHILAIIMLLRSIWKKRSCSGISGKSQVLFAIVFISRYLDLFTQFISLYNTVGKVIFLITSFATVYLIYFKFRTSYNHTQDTFYVIFIIAPCVILSLVDSGVSDLMETMWAFSIFLEALAIMPQMFMIVKTKEAEVLTSHYLFALGLYRAFYILNWVYRYIYESYFDLAAVIAGLVQTALYLDFFYLYIKNVIYGSKMRLPTRST